MVKDTRRKDMFPWDGVALLAPLSPRCNICITGKARGVPFLCLTHFRKDWVWAEMVAVARQNYRKEKQWWELWVKNIKCPHEKRKIWGKERGKNRGKPGEILRRWLAGLAVSGQHHLGSGWKCKSLCSPQVVTIGGTQLLSGTFPSENTQGVDLRDFMS